MSKSNLWKQVDELVTQGKQVVVTVPAGTEIKNSKRPPGRPRVNPPGKPLHGMVMATPSGHQMRCRNIGCNEKMGKYDLDIVCSEECRAELRDFCEHMLNILNGVMPPEDLPLRLRTRDDAMKRTARKEKAQEQLEEEKRYKPRKKQKSRSQLPQHLVRPISSYAR